jgi:Cof subfamily protein (haloacid dehalogenase superfamily)
MWDMVLALRAKGMQFAAASGRQWASIEQMFEPVKEKIFYISDNGAYVGCHGRNLFLNKLDRGASDAIIADAREAGLDIMLSAPDVVYMDRRNMEFVDWMRDGYRYRVNLVDDLARVGEDLIKVSLYKKSGIEAATAQIREKYKDRLKITISGDMWMDAMVPGVSKGWAINLLQESLFITPRETMAFGDQLNDLEMLDAAYYSFAVGNARPEVKAAARFQADLCERDGVLKILGLL